MRKWRVAQLIWEKINSIESLKKNHEYKFHHEKERWVMMMTIWWKKLCAWCIFHTFNWAVVLLSFFKNQRSQNFRHVRNIAKKSFYTFAFLYLSFNLPISLPSLPPREISWLVLHRKCIKRPSPAPTSKDVILQGEEKSCVV